MAVRIEVESVQDASAVVDALLHLASTAGEPAERVRYQGLADAIGDGLDGLPRPSGD
jgi:hypothetical protein